MVARRNLKPSLDGVLSTLVAKIEQANTRPHGVKVATAGEGLALESTAGTSLMLDGDRARQWEDSRTEHSSRITTAEKDLTAAEGRITTAEKDLDAVDLKAGKAQDTADRAALQAVNAVADPSFEARAAGHALSTGWSVSGTVARTGSKSAHAPAASNVRAFNAAFRVPVLPGQTWRASAWVKTSADYNGTSSNGKLRLGQQANGFLAASAWGPSTTWARRTFDYTVPADGTVSQLILSLNADHTAGDVWVDDVELRDVTDVLALDGKATAAKDAAATAQGTADAARTEADKANAALVNTARFGDFELDGINKGSHAAFTIKRDSALARSGKRYAEGPIDAAAKWLYLPDVPVIPGRRYRVSFYMWISADVTGSAGFPAMWRRDDGTVYNAEWPPVYSWSHRTEQVVGAWFKVEGTVTAPAGVIAMLPRFYLWPDVAPAGTIVRFDDLEVLDVEDALTAQAKADKAEADAAAAHARAGDALTAADAAQKTADGKTASLYSTAAPSGTGKTNGDTWRQVNAAGTVIGAWQWDSTLTTPAWVKRPVGSEAIDNLDVGKLTAGTADILEATAQKLAARTLTVTGTLTARQGFFTDGLTANEATLLGTTVAENISADKVGARLMEAGTLRAVATDGTSAAVEVTAAGYKAWDAAGTLSVDLNGKSNLVTGKLQTAPEGRRVMIWDRSSVAAIDLYGAATTDHGGLWYLSDTTTPANSAMFLKAQSGGIHKAEDPGFIMYPVAESIRFEGKWDKRSRGMRFVEYINTAGLGPGAFLNVFVSYPTPFPTGQMYFPVITADTVGGVELVATLNGQDNTGVRLQLNNKSGNKATDRIIVRIVTFLVNP